MHALLRAQLIAHGIRLDSGRTAAATLVERTTRFPAVLGLPLGRTADGVADAVSDHTTVLPAMFAQTLTWDQGTELARHAHITTATQMAIYFAHPHSPWQRGSNENTNRMVRRYLPKSTPITDHQPYLTAIAEERRKVSPKIAWSAEIHRVKNVAVRHMSSRRARHPQVLISARHPAGR